MNPSSETHAAAPRSDAGAEQGPLLKAAVVKLTGQVADMLQTIEKADDGS